MKKPFFGTLVSKKLDSVRNLPPWLRNYPNHHDQIKLIRETLGMTQAQLAKSIGCSRRYILSIENGHATPAISTLTKLSDALNAELKIYVIPKIPLAEFLEEKASQKARQIVNLSKTSSSLEAQTPSDEAKQEQVESLTREILDKRRSSLWER
jgi:transcriptional regulator with XRE-family HTH domain